MIRNETDMPLLCSFTQICDLCRGSLSLTDACRPREPLPVGEAVRPLTCPALLLQEEGHVVPWWVSDAAAPQGLCDPQQLAHTSRDDLRGAQRGGGG